MHSVLEYIDFEKALSEEVGFAPVTDCHIHLVFMTSFKMSQTLGFRFS